MSTNLITHNTQLRGLTPPSVPWEDAPVRHVQSYAEDGRVVVDLNGPPVNLLRLDKEDANTLIALLQLALGDLPVETIAVRPRS